MQKEKSEKKQGFVSEVFDYLEIFIFAACVVLVLFLTMIRVCTVDGDSMNNTLKSGQMLLVSDVAYEPDNGDVIVFHETGEYYNKALVKRVIATEGQWISIEYGLDKSMRVYVSDDANITEDDLVDEPYVYLGSNNGSYEDLPPTRVPEGCVFAMGDNRYNSSDSRSKLIGFIDEKQILGKVLLRITPISEFGVVD